MYHCCGQYSTSVPVRLKLPAVSPVCVVYGFGHFGIFLPPLDIFHSIFTSLFFSKDGQVLDISTEEFGRGLEVSCAASGPPDVIPPAFTTNSKHATRDDGLQSFVPRCRHVIIYVVIYHNVVPKQNRGHEEQIERPC